MSLNEEQVIQRLQSTPGIDFILVVEQHEFETVDDIYQIALKEYADLIAGKSFCVRAKRTGKHDFNSLDVEQYVGGGLLHNTEAARVQLKNPEYTVNLEIRGNLLSTIKKRVAGLGGYPLGQQDGCLSLISGGFDSCVASYLMNNRGVITHFCFFNLGGTAHEVGVKQVAHYLWEKFSISHPVKFVTVPFERVVDEILSKVHHSMMGVVLKRMMVRAATQVAEELNLPALVTGESVGQVSSQTLVNLKVIDNATDALILRPLITMDKQKIISVARAIGTEEFAANMPEYCGVISQRPTTRAKLDLVEAEEANFDSSILATAIESKKIESILHVLESKTSSVDIDVVSIPAVDDVVIDIRHPNEQEVKPLTLTNNPVLHIPFFKLAGEREQLDSTKNYLLYCDKGVMSQLQAQELIEFGLANVKVFAPD